ncbi:MAG: 4Fe-4S dicluster domain-containing protein [Phycisphaerales bacterium]|nr:MAG: 4Fe-4S dicluster domain-containing protein [Phycisphaerales bacterium]
MSHYILEPCIGTKDTACVAVCPVDCIHPTKEEDDFEREEMLYIDPDTCIDCGLCIDECPVQAIVPEDEVPPDQEHFKEKNAAYYAKKQN